MAIDVLRQAQGNNLSDTLSTSIGSTDTTIPVNTISIWSANGGKVIIDRGLSTQEIVYCSGVSGSSLVVQAGGRGLEGTTAQGHNVGAAVESVPTAKDWNDLVTSVENVLVKSTGLLDTTKVATPSAVSDFATNFANFIKSGLTIPTSASLSATSVAGTIYYNGVEISVASDGGHTYTASNDCYVDVSNAGVYTYNSIANGAAAPALTANSIRIAKVVTSGTAVTGVTQSGLDSLGNAIYPNNPSINPTHNYTIFNQVTTPATPSSGQDKVYTKSDDNLYILNHSGTETVVGSRTDGWIPSSDTLTYASASSFTISGVDRTAVYAKGTRIKFTNNAATFYGVVASSSFSTDTTVTLFANSDYSIANSAITAPFYSYASNPQGYPTTFNYACSWTNTSTNPAIGNGTFTAKFWVQGNVCTTNIHIIGGSTTTWGTGIEYSWSLPVNPITGTLGDFTGSAILTQNSSGLEVANCLVNSASTMGIVAGAGSFQSLRVNTTNPVTWTTNDKFNMTLSYIF